jgi:hypothetical protein
MSLFLYVFVQSLYVFLSVHLCFYMSLFYVILLLCVCDSISVSVFEKLCKQVTWKKVDGAQNEDEEG